MAGVDGAAGNAQLLISLSFFGSPECKAVTQNDWVSAHPVHGKGL
jgi:hypothetical protein